MPDSTFDDDLRAALTTFTVEAGDLLADMERSLLDLDAGSGDRETINALFRAAHTIKGSSGLFGLDHVVHFTHAVESVLDRVRNDELPVTSELVAVLLPCKDHIAGLVDRAAAGETDESEASRAAGAALLDRLAGYLTAAPAGSDPAPADEATGVARRSSRRLHLSLRFGPDCLRNGLDPVPFIRYLATFGEVEAVRVVDGLLPPAAELDPEACYLAFQVVLQTDADPDAVADVFEFVREDSDIHILAADAPGAEFDELADSFGPCAEQVRGILDELRGPSTDGPNGPALPSASPAAAGELRDRRKNDIGTLRVDASRLDRLIDTVGELVIAGAAASLGAAVTGDEDLRAAVADVMRLIEGVREDALMLRMVPIGTIFNRFQRVVHDVARDLGKDVSLVITGGDTEVDKTLVERIGDPLLHLVRNALDHGIESADARLAQRKPARGTLRLHAYHDSGSIVVTVTDDGRGIDRERVLARAVERGLVEPGAVLTDKDVYSLIFEPGFSTAAAVSDLSGRGVGLDVVKRNVAALRGSIEVTSTPEEGTTVRLQLPLTLAIIGGFMVGVGDATFVVPLDRVVECVALPPTAARRNIMDLRGEVLPLIRLRDALSVDGPPSRRQNVVVVEHAGTKAGLVVDALKGEFQTVIKPLGNLFAHVEGIGGSTILGNGEVALILEVPLLLRHAIAHAA